MRLEHAPPNEKLYANPLLGVQATGNSNAMRGAWKPLREAGATARVMLVAAAAKRWGVDAKSCRAEDGRGAPRADRPTLEIGELAAEAAKAAGPLRRRRSSASRFQADRHAGQASRRAGEGERNGGLWHRRSSAGREDCNFGAIAGLRRAREEPG